MLVAAASKTGLVLLLGHVILRDCVPAGAAATLTGAYAATPTICFRWHTVRI